MIGHYSFHESMEVAMDLLRADDSLSPKDAKPEVGVKINKVILEMARLEFAHKERIAEVVKKAKEDDKRLAKTLREEFGL